MPSRIGSRNRGRAWNNAIWRDPINGYRKYLDDRASADYFILNTLTRNATACSSACFPEGRRRKTPHGAGLDYIGALITYPGPT